MANVSPTYASNKPHPDGKPWAKCCKGHDSDNCCQCFMRKPRNGESRASKAFAELVETLREQGARFMRVHRETEDGYHRECAGWAAKVTKNRP